MSIESLKNLVLVGLALGLGLAACAGAEVREEDTVEGAVLGLVRQTCMAAEGDGRIAACRRVVRAKPDDAEAEAQLGGLLVQADQLAEGVAHLRKSLRLQPGVPGVLEALAVALDKRGDREAAVQAYRDALEKLPERTDLRLALAVLLRKLKLKDEALAELQAAVARDPRSAAAWAQLSLTLAQASRLPEAIEAGQKAVELEPKDANARSNLGLFMSSADRLPEAIEQLCVAVELEPGNATAHYNLGLAYTRADDLELAVRAYRKALEVKEDFPQAHHNLAVVFMGMGICQLSRGHFARSHELGVRSAQIVLDQFKKICEPPPPEAPDAPAPADKPAS